MIVFVKLEPFRFPAEPESRNLWIEATKRNNWVPKKSSKICSQHFHGTSFMKIGKKTFLNPKAVPLEVRSVVIYYYY